MKIIGKIGDKVLSALVPAKNATAGCPSDCYTERQKLSSGNCRYRRCCFTSSCNLSCGPWTRPSTCP
ncbi:hypothetical protein [Phytomonospora endophytica]|uniref:Uncharacterized protein n=1 Tax=Phytomonospora endophytica TaxID=714109 RepID=A0A841FMZ1_9ACTN|nr:hypothetical protein [Phytomonospora endophytica]MBB6034587.1 hypothetical protein [Phytomonospora endophytica]GIG71353.1 hypothetical protein Pen01_76480 [Phytomonospora endophytica]